MQHRIYRRPLLLLGRHLRRIFLLRIPFAELHLLPRENDLRQCRRFTTTGLRRCRHFTTKFREITGQLMLQSFGDVLMQVGLQQKDIKSIRTLHHLLNRSVWLHCQMVSVEFSIGCSFSADLLITVVQVMKSITPIQDRADLSRLFGNWSTVSRNLSYAMVVRSVSLSPASWD